MSSTPAAAPSDSPGAGGAADPASEPRERRRALVEALVLFAISTVACIGLHLARPIPFVQNNLHTLVAAVFIYLPTALLLRGRRDFRAYGLTVAPVGQNLLVFALAALLVLPAFGAGFFVYQSLLCKLGWSSPGLCEKLAARLADFRVLFPPDMPSRIAAQVLVVAIPEELFYRGYLMTRLDHAFPPRWRLFGATVGPALLVQAGLFGIGHFVIDLDPRRLGVAIPALAFGWMRARTGSIGAAALFHAACNLTMEIVVRTAFRAF